MRRNTQNHIKKKDRDGCREIWKRGKEEKKEKNTKKERNALT
jgi:hypothetical protein